MNPLDDIHDTGIILIDDTPAKGRIIGEYRIDIETDQPFHRFFFVDSPDKNTFSRTMDTMQMSPVY